ncbi:hypothetical protein L198_07353 [Cryptococcus wingfieldii CBS 7118]|uniref:SET domain-containing protein n=1 Tax=Cryptococcus wingfieldii CBS 7118 TaxID=1295528 RepID=A0A1E3ICN0_9TREE|nr:hypothetical protein L198_07353 [Cryptococcus wingfieldii CBS 7118]ODN86334.1 hypothetical protein L198_07353 [Cryptococcus wingfieldii CBS 7118]
MGLDIFRQISKTNCYGGHSVAPMGLGFEGMLEKRILDDFTAAVGAGRVGEKKMLLHGMPAMLNHSWWGNMTECSFGDVMVMRASRHIAKGNELLIFKKMIWAKTPEEFQRHRAELAEPARNYIDTNDTALYACHALRIARFGLVSSNTVEQLNDWLLVARGGDIITLFSTIYDHLSASFRDRHDLLVVKPRLVERDLIQHVFRKVAAEQCKAKYYRVLVTGRAGRSIGGAHEEEFDEQRFLLGHEWDG